MFANVRQTGSLPASSKTILEIPGSKTVKNTQDKVVRQGESAAQPSNSPASGRTEDSAINEVEELGRLLGVIAHEIKNPLSTIKVNLRLLDEQLQDTASSAGNRPAGDDLNDRITRARRKISVIAKETTRLEQILDGFLRYANRTQPRLSPVDLNGLLSDIVDFYLPQAAAHSITMRQHLSKEPLICQVDAAMLKQAILNLFINAQQALGHEGELVVRSAPQGRFANIHIGDTGAGITPDRIDRIFEPYQSSKPGGTGLGLATVKKIITAHKGTIAVDSEPGKGTSFTIALPLDSEKEQGAGNE